MSNIDDPSGQHAEGVQHIASNTAPPGTEDTSRGTEGGVGTGAESGGVSSTSSEAFKSPLVPNSGSSGDGTSSQGGMMDTVKSYLGYGSGAGAAETGQLGTTGDAKNVEDTSAGSGSGSGVSGAAASAASAVGMSSGNAAAGGGLGSTSSSSGTDAENKDSASGSTLEAAKENVQDATGTSEKKESTSGNDDHKPPQPASGKPKRLENESAIPTAGGERLGEKHWGESKVVPDDPSKRASAAGVSSEEGQPTQQTTDNTAKNTGGATGPPPSSNKDSGSGGAEGEEKASMMDKMKDKLHMGKKE